ANAIPANQTWVFWLADHGVPARLLQSGSKIFAYKAGKQVNVNSWISSRNNLGLPNGLTQVPIFKEISASATNSNIIWRDGFGKPVLAVSSVGKAQLYQFYSR